MMNHVVYIIIQRTRKALFEIVYIDFSRISGNMFDNIRFLTTDAHWKDERDE